ncbi:FliH/SctL family protein [Alicyclobacillus fastidiosus]|uniref:FliH/SctL family protein n=1 Tax=Alicyclobacillus fastidiosus TaxID=392011 RepID=A0ABY6ZP86_9BACL|nr:FliH/SctL family protein [Alicyclobacillus fastidiosus]WAH44649.1 FliH/SctL family protein [Alicyclobacillus fastidiosus]
MLKHLTSTWLPDGMQPIPIATTEAEVAVGLDPLDVEAELVVDSAAILAEAEAACEQMLANATAQARDLVERARAEAESVRLAAEHAGFEEGLRRGREEANVAFGEWKAQEQAALTAIAQGIDEQRAQSIAALQPVVEEVAMAAVQKLLYRELATEPADIGSMVEELLHYVIHSTSVQVRVHPDDYTAARQAHPKWKMLNYGEWEITVVPDPALSPGDCDIRGTGGRVDATVRTRLDELRHTLHQLTLQQGDAVGGTDT